MAERLARQPQEVERLRLAHALGISYKRLHGWEPRTFQRGFDRNGQPCALADAWEVVTETEPEWDDEERGRLLALARFEAGVCECGFHKSLTGDTSNHFTFEVEVCSVCKGASQYGRIQQESDKQARGEKPDPKAPDPADGRRTHIRMMSAAEVEERRASRGPRRSR